MMTDSEWAAAWNGHYMRAMTEKARAETLAASERQIAQLAGHLEAALRGVAAMMPDLFAGVDVASMAREMAERIFRRR